MRVKKIFNIAVDNEKLVFAILSNVDKCLLKLVSKDTRHTLNTTLETPITDVRNRTGVPRTLRDEK